MTERTPVLRRTPVSSGVVLRHGDLLDVLPSLSENSIDSVVCDPPYEIGFMSSAWDKSSVSYLVETWKAVFRVLKPGGHLLAFGGTRTFHRLTCAIEDAGFEIRDCLMWMYGQGFPKSSDVLYPVMIRSGICLSSEPARHAVVTSKWLPLESDEVKEPIVLALAEIRPGGGKGLLTAIGRVGTSSAATVMCLFGPRGGGTSWSTDLSWSGISGAFSDPMKTSITGMEIEQIIGSETWSLLLGHLTSRTTTHRRETRPSGCRCPASLVVEYSSDGDTRHFDIPTLFVPEPATSRERLLRLGGVGQNLKPAWEPIILARKPLSESTVAANVLKWGTGALNIEGCRLDYMNETDKASATPQGKVTSKEISAIGAEPDAGRGLKRVEFQRPELKGRWPANVTLSHFEECVKVGEKEGKGYVINRWTDGAKPFGGGVGHPYETEEQGPEVVEVWACVPGCPVRMLDDQSGNLLAGTAVRHRSGGKTFGGEKPKPPMEDMGYGSGGASRFFYCSKASRSEREAGLDALPATLFAFGNQAQAAARRGETETRATQDIGLNRIVKVRNVHPTVKPVALMRWLCRLVTPPKGRVLDPFLGSGTTGIAAVLEGFKFVGIEIEESYYKIAQARIAHWGKGRGSK